MVEIKIKKMSDKCIIPTKAHDTDACFDIYNAEETAKWINSNSSAKFRTGFSTEIPKGYFCPVFARSGLGINKNLRPSNCVGVIDSDYRGEWIVALFNDGRGDQCIMPGDRIAQFAVLPVPEVKLIEVDELENTERGSGGFGSTGQ